MNRQIYKKYNWQHASTELDICTAHIEGRWAGLRVYVPYGCLIYPAVHLDIRLHNLLPKYITLTYEAQLPSCAPGQSHLKLSGCATRQAESSQEHYCIHYTL